MSSDATADNAKTSARVEIDSIVVAQQTSPLWHRVLSFLWDSADGDVEYRRYIRRLDLGLLYVSASDTSSSISIKQITAMPSSVACKKTCLYMATNGTGWTLGSLWASSLMFALRFFIGLFESCAFPGYIAIHGSWYGPQELAKRTAVLLEVESIASMFSGYLQAGLYNGMNEKHGLAGWRWSFVMDGVISIPAAIAGFTLLPDKPHTTKAFYWSAEHIRYGIERVEKFGHQAPVKLTLKESKRILSTWQLWVMIAACHTATSYFNLWLKAEGYSVDKINYLPTGGNAPAIVITLAWGMIADRTGKFYWLIISLQFLTILSNILLSVWHISRPALMFAYYLSYAGSAATPVPIAWASKLNAGDPNLRQLLVAVANVVSYAWVLWVPLVLFPTYDAPKYKYGYQVLILFGGLAITFVTTLKVLHGRLSPKRAVDPVDEDLGHKTSGTEQELTA
ncbi:Putative major facilitator superfamily, MFS transporter superfamily [Septoria linicola]|uniref:Major facilitator superfamily, MFS transporter superfamily n=1 Tax=Septoria linicola TaxID=215465 RepID=A0A9Q9EIZ3_9PEZI|nr:Putative major facilitator superfamily, MFS transporter superfamily [Septoria linicola]